MKKFSFNQIVLLATVAFIGATNTNLLNAQALEIIGNVIHIAPNELPNTTGANYVVHSLAFNKGDNSSVNRGYWGMGTLFNGFSIGIQHPCTNAGVSMFIDNATRSVCIGGWQPLDPNAKLDVRGNIKALNVALSSDKRYKKDIKPINTNIDKLSKLNSVEYKASTAVLEQQRADFIKQFDAQDTAGNAVYHQLLRTIENQIADRKKDTVTHFGFIAQELREIYPNLVSEDSEGYLSVNYIEMIPVLVNAINEQQKQINELKGVSFDKNATVVISEAKLYQNNPNPFSENTEIKYYVPESSSSAMICIYDLVGSQIMKFENLNKGYSSLTVRGSELKAGMYIYALLVDGKEIDTKRMILTDK